MTTSAQHAKSSSLSVVMIVKNEGTRLRGCLQSVQPIADEIVILDAGSTDETAAIAASFGAKFYTNTDWQGFGRQRQLAQKHATGDYVLMMDGDERLDETLTQSIRELLTQPVQREHAFAVLRQDTYFGRFVYHFASGKRLPRLYARDTFEFRDQTVHESLDCDRSATVVLQGTLIHCICIDLHELKRKQLRYAVDWARMKAKSGRRVTLIGVYVRAFMTFFRDYVMLGSLFSGALGFIVALNLSVYTFNKYMLLWQLNRSASEHQHKRKRSSGPDP